MCYDIAYPERRGELSPGGVTNWVSLFMKRDYVKAYLDELRAAADEQIKLRIGDFVQTIADRASDPMERFAHLEHEPIERVNTKTGEVLGYELHPVVSGIEDIGHELRRYVEQLVWEPTCGKFRVIPRDNIDEKTRAKYADMTMKAGGGYAPERLEITGADGAPIETITGNMTAVEAAEIYKKTVRNNKS
jgi:hypothetical protein